jgi:bla regulator protein blaR1
MTAALESLTLSFLANALWQIPLLFLGGWLVARAVGSFGSRAEHRVWVTVLVLQVILPTASVIPFDGVRSLISFSGALHERQPRVSIAMGPGSSTLGNPHLPTWALAAIAISYACVTAWFVARFAWRLFAVRLLTRNTVQVALSVDLEKYWTQCQVLFGVRNACLGASTQLFGPITIGIKRKLVLLPAEMLETLPDAELRTAVAHEFAHMQRCDYLKNLLYELLSLPICFHPALNLTRSRLMETREMVCDQLAARIAGAHGYARSLLRLASLLVGELPTRTPHAIGIFDATTLERRIMRLTEKPSKPTTLRRLMTALACFVLGLGICATALGLSVHVDAMAAGDEPHPAKPSGPVAVKAEIMQNQILHKISPVYPEEAKKARIQGKVQLNAVIGKNGEIEELKVVSGPRELQQSAVDAVRQWTYKPFLLNGEPVDVKTTINVTYTLARK